MPNGPATADDVPAAAAAPHLRAIAQGQVAQGATFGSSGGWGTLDGDGPAATWDSQPSFIFWPDLATSDRPTSRATPASEIGGSAQNDPDADGIAATAGPVLASALLVGTVLNVGSAAASGPITGGAGAVASGLAFLADPGADSMSSDAGSIGASPSRGGSVEPTPTITSIQALAVNQAQTEYLTATGMTLDGAGLKIGIISDSFNVNGSEAAAQAAGDLPPDSQIDILEEGPAGATDEGQGMAELVYQIAPAATIYFYSGDYSQQDFANGIEEMVQDGVNVIVDDLDYYTEPFYQAGSPISQAIDYAVSQGVDYFTAAGNSGNNYYEAAFNPQPITLPGISGALMVHAVSGDSPYEAISLGADPTLEFTLEWDEPFAATRYDLGVALYSQSGGSYTLVQAFTVDDLGGDPVLFEDLPGTIAAEITGGTYDLAFFEKESETIGGVPVTPGEFKIIITDNSNAVIDGVGAGVGSGTSIGHQLVAGANTVGAVNIDETPAAGVTTPVVEPYSATGPGVIYLDADGNTLAQPETIGTPEFVATDGDDTAWSDPFDGTSAAAPHAAAVALLMLQADPRLATTQVTYLLERSAIPTGDTVTGGAGLIQADTAVAAALTLAETPVWTDQDATSSWSDKLNWSDSAVPSAGSDVSITDGDGIFTGSTPEYDVYDDDASDTVAALTVDGGTITGAQPFLIVFQNTLLTTGTLTLGAGAIDVAGTLTDTGTLATGSAVGTIDIESGLLSIGASAGHAAIDFNDLPAGEVVFAAGTATLIDGIQATLDDFVSGDTIDLSQLPNAIVAGVDVDGSAVTVVDNEGGTLATLTVAGLSGGLTHATDSEGGTELIACFAEGTRISTEHGPVTVERLAVGDRLRTLGGTLRPVLWIGHRRLDLRRHPAPELVRPVRIAAGALADGVPARMLVVSPDHALLVDGALIPARLLVNHRSISAAMELATVTYFHVELDRHDIILAEGAPAESYLDTGNRSVFEAGPVAALHPDLSTGQSCQKRGAQMAGAGMRLTTDAARVWPIWRRLAQRAGSGLPAVADGGGPAQVVLIAGTRRVRPAWAADGRLAFALPRQASKVRLVCPSGRPNERRPWLDDRRRLGMAICDLRADDRRLALDGPALADGWWPVEHAGARAFRWTDGDAALSLPADAAVLTLRLHAAMAAARGALPVVA